MNKREALRKYFGHETFRGAQEQLIDSILSGRDCLGVMPTGAGKSICFQLPALLMNGTALVISPLISLMRDQVEALVQSGINAACINSSIDEDSFARIYQNALERRYKLIYIAPERLFTPRFSQLVSNIEISLVAVDEAHCVSQWGQDFRPSYLKIRSFVQSIQKRPVTAAFTATATDRVKSDIVEMLGLVNPLEITTGFDRPNLFFEVRSPESKEEELLKILKEKPDGSVIIYCSTRKNVENVCSLLQRHGFRAGQYHAGFSAKDRSAAQEDFLFDRIDVMVATNAFGMGIDKSNVRLVVHYNCPKDIESYYQEAGRAGRDGGTARCILLYSDSDKSLAEYMIQSSFSESKLPQNEAQALKERDLTRLRAMTSYCKSKKCLRRYILNYFGESAGAYCGNCGNCTKGDEVVDVTIAAQKILSCIFRLKQRNITLPAGEVCKILLGDPAFSEYSDLSTFGIMTENYTRIMQIAQYLCSEGYFEECGARKICVLTPRADEFVRAKKPIVMRFHGKKLSKGEKLPENPELFEDLRKLRRRFAEALGVPPYVVFSDESLREMCVILPRSMDEFLTISGVGTRKAERYGKKFLSVINNYVETRKNQN